MLITVSYALLWLAVVIYLVNATSGRSWLGRAATGITIASLLVLTVALIQRGLISGHWPLTNVYEVSLFLTWTIISIYLLLETSLHERRLGHFVLAVAILTASYAITRPEVDKAMAPLLPALRSIYLQVHVTSAVIGYGAWGVACGLGFAYLIRPKHADEFEESQLYPSLEMIEGTMMRIISLGIPWLTLGILTGAIWAQNAWGRYWGWDPKEIWALITWLWYILILHLQTMRKWKGRRLAILVIIGFGLVLFTFIGVPWLVRTIRLESLHGF